ncbi:MAG TPA: iron-containing redox enzyme family protein [Acidimicrobiales bacterium]
MTTIEQSPGPALDEQPTIGDRPALPLPRGPFSHALIGRLTMGTEIVPRPDRAAQSPDPLVDDDLQLGLHIIYELSYRGFRGIDDAFEWDDQVIALRRLLEQRFESSLRTTVGARGLVGDARHVADVIRRFRGPSLSSYMERSGTAEQFREFAVHRSAYQLKEADPHSWAIPRTTGPRKAALVEIQMDEYGRGRPGASHAELFADVLDSLGIDATYGVHVDALPAVTLATGNLISMFGMQMRLRSALLGHLAGFEMTSVGPMTNYLLAAIRLGFDDRVQRFYDVHVEADHHHGALAADVLAAPGSSSDTEDSELLFGAAAMLVVEDRFARHLLHAWAHDRTSLRPT